MELRRLEVFCKVIELRSFSRAADAALISQPTVSEHIRILEETLGERLLDRLGRETLPTPAGTILYDYARRILQLRDEAVQTLERFRGKLAGNLIIGASTIPGAYILPSSIESFHSHHPDCRITLRISGTAQIVRELLDGPLELGLVGASPRDVTLESEEIFGDELLLAIWPGHPWQGRRSVSPDELTGHPFILRETASGTRSATEAALKRGGIDPGRLSVVAEMGSNEAVREGVKGRLGVSFISSLALAEDVKRGTLCTVAVEGISMRRHFFLLRRRGRQLTPLGCAFLAHLRNRED